MNTDDETTDAENIVSYKLKEVEQILIVDASSTTETEEAEQVTEEVGCDDLTEEVIDYETNIYEEVIDVAEEVTEKTRVVIVDEPENSCDICNFVGKTPAGLKTHKRPRHRLFQVLLPEFCLKFPQITGPKLLQIWGAENPLRGNAFKKF